MTPIIDCHVHLNNYHEQIALSLDESLDRLQAAMGEAGVVYALVNTTTGERLYVKTYANDPDPELPSVVALWKGADWMEREVYVMYGVRFAGHPDLRRILMPAEFTEYPLRKDYPLRGHGERHNFPAVTRAES